MANQAKLTEDIVAKTHYLSRIVGTQFHIPAEGASAEEQLKTVSDGLNEILKMLTWEAPVKTDKSVKSMLQLIPLCSDDIGQVQHEHLDSWLANRPSFDEMVKQGVIHSPTVAPKLAGPQHDLEQQLMAITLKRQLEKRHEPKFLVDHNILHGSI